MATLISVLGLLSACGKDGTVSLQFLNSTARSVTHTTDALRATESAPTEFKMKLIAAYLAADIDPDTGTNIGETQMIYLNPNCTNISACDISGGTVDGNVITDIITTYFDFGLSSSEVNANLNAQGRSVAVGTYKYVRIEFCKANTENAENIQWAGGSASGTQSFQRNSCTVNSNEMNPPLVLAEGATATVSLTYDMSTSVQVGADAAGDNCTGTGATKTCFTLPTFVPSAS